MARFTTEVVLRSGDTAVVRPLVADDVDALATLFLSLSDATKNVYGPHRFDRETAEKLCASIDENRVIRFVAVLGDGTADVRIIGYMILTREIDASDLERYGERLKPETCASFAPVVADAYQDQGIGSRMAQHVMASARLWGLAQVILMGGVLHMNPRAKHLYTKLGFKQVGEFWTRANGEDRLNYDMILEFE